MVLFLLQSLETQTGPKDMAVLAQDRAMSQADHPSSRSPYVGEPELRLVLLQNLAPRLPAFASSPLASTGLDPKHTL